MNIQQIDIAPLMSYLIGVPIPINSLVYSFYLILFCMKKIKNKFKKGKNSFGITRQRWKREMLGFQNERVTNSRTAESKYLKKNAIKDLNFQSWKINK